MSKEMREAEAVALELPEDREERMDRKAARRRQEPPDPPSQREVDAEIDAYNAKHGTDY